MQVQLELARTRDGLGSAEQGQVTARAELEAIREDNTQLRRASEGREKNRKAGWLACLARCRPAACCARACACELLPAPASLGAVHAPLRLGVPLTEVDTARVCTCRGQLNEEQLRASKLRGELASLSSSRMREQQDKGGLLSDTLSRLQVGAQPSP